MGALVVVWAGAVGALLLSARSDLLEARDELDAVRDDADEEDALLEERTVRRLEAAEETLRRAGEKVDNPIVAPLRVLPFVGRQVRSIDALTDGAAEVTDVAGRTLSRAQDLVGDLEGPGSDRVAVIRGLADAAGEAAASLAEVDAGPSDALVGQLDQARRELTEEVAELEVLLDDVHVGASGLASMLEGPNCYLLFAANNAEMRAGSGMFLQATDLCFDGGRISMGELVPTGDLLLRESEAVPIADPDLADRWGPLYPNAEFRNLALSPRFGVNAELAAEMWRVATGQQVEGVFSVDPVALRAILAATGPVRVDGRRYGADGIVEEMLIGQYEGFLEDDYDADARSRSLGRVASEALEALDSGRWETDVLVDELVDAAAGRHLLAWARDPEVQRSFERMEIAGELGPRSVAVNVLNRGGGDGGGKLDPHLAVEADWSVDDVGDDGQQVTLDVELHNTVEPGTPTYAETPESSSVRFGVYVGVLAVNVPGAARDARIEGEDLYVAGTDGPTRVVASRFELGPGERRSFVVRFQLPDGMREVLVEPSAREPAIRWTTGDDTFYDNSHETVAW